MAASFGSDGMFRQNPASETYVRCILTTSATPERLIADASTTAEKVLMAVGLRLPDLPAPVLAFPGTLKTIALAAAVIIGGLLLLGRR